MKHLTETPDTVEWVGIGIHLSQDQNALAK